MKHFFSLLVISALCLCAAAAQSTIFIVRHAEKAASAGKDPDLSEAGRVRAEALAKTLKDANIAAIYATEFKRTQQTAAPLAKALGISVTNLPAKDIAALTAKLRTSNGNALVVGHGDTIPGLIKAMSISAPIKIMENDYDNFFIVVLDEKPQLIRLHY
jgi:broad specificity phosphatase PhoE